MLAETSKLSLFSFNVKQIVHSSFRLQTLLQHPYMHVFGHTANLDIVMLRQRNLELQNDLQNVARYFDDVAAKLQCVEKQLLVNAENIAFFPSKNQLPFDIRQDTMKFQHRNHSTLSFNRSIKDYINNGICAGTYVGFDMYTIRANKNMKYLQINGNVSLGKASLSLDAKGLLYDDEKLKPSLILEGSLQAALAKASATVNIGNSYVYANGEASVGIGVVSAQAKAVINKEEIALKAEVGAAAVRGEVKGCISIFGIKITASASGEIGSIGASAEFSKKKGEFEIGSHCSFLAGVGFKIKVNY